MDCFVATLLAMTCVRKLPAMTCARKLPAMTCVRKLPAMTCVRKLLAMTWGEIRHRERSAAIHAAGRLENCMKIIDKKEKM